MYLFFLSSWFWLLFFLFVRGFSMIAIIFLFFMNDVPIMHPSSHIQSNPQQHLLLVLKRLNVLASHSRRLANHSTRQLHPTPSPQNRPQTRFTIRRSSLRVARITVTRKCMWGLIRCRHLLRTFFRIMVDGLVFLPLSILNSNIPFSLSILFPIHPFVNLSHLSILQSNGPFQERRYMFRCRRIKPPSLSSLPVTSLSLNPWDYRCILHLLTPILLSNHLFLLGKLSNLNIKSAELILAFTQDNDASKIVCIILCYISSWFRFTCKLGF